MLRGLLARVATVLVGVTASIAPLAAQAPCPERMPLPAYAHNDYDNGAPLHDALRLGYAGVEADVVLVNGALLVAHDRRGARSGRTFETLYLRPLRELVARCATVQPRGRRFLLNVELKERSPAAYDSLTALLGRYSDLVASAHPLADTLERAPTRARQSPVEVMLVGWHPPLAELARRDTLLARVQAKITSIDGSVDTTSAAIGMVSLDYGKTVGRDRRHAGEWLATLRRAKLAVPGRLARVYNVPPRAEIYAVLLGAGVDLIGTEDLRRTRRELTRLLAVDRTDSAP